MDRVTQRGGFVRGGGGGDQDALAGLGDVANGPGDDDQRGESLGGTRPRVPHQIEQVQAAAAVGGQLGDADAGHREELLEGGAGIRQTERG